MAKFPKYEETPFVGMFYAIGSIIYYVMVPVDQGDRQEDDVSTNTTHYEWWRYIYRILKRQNPHFDIEDHEYIPRGRVIYNSGEDIYYLYIDRCIRKNKRQMQEILNTMHLPKGKTKVVTNFHYQCEKCRKD